MESEETLSEGGKPAACAASQVRLFMIKRKQSQGLPPLVLITVRPILLAIQNPGQTIPGAWASRIQVPL